MHSTVFEKTHEVTDSTIRVFLLTYGRSKYARCGFPSAKNVKPRILKGIVTTK